MRCSFNLLGAVLTWMPSVCDAQDMRLCWGASGSHQKWRGQQGQLSTSRVRRPLDIECTWKQYFYCCLLLRLSKAGQFMWSKNQDMLLVLGCRLTRSSSSRASVADMRSERTFDISAGVSVGATSVRLTALSIDYQSE
jgi:hypothetical protein